MAIPSQFLLSSSPHVNMAGLAFDKSDSSSNTGVIVAVTISSVLVGGVAAIAVVYFIHRRRSHQLQHSAIEMQSSSATQCDTTTQTPTVSQPDSTIAVGSA